MHFHWSREDKTGLRAWLNFNGRKHRSVDTEILWWSRFCHIGVEVGDEGWLFSLAVPPLAVWLCVNVGWWVPQRKAIFTWDNNREVMLPDHREFKLAIHDWTIWFTPWGKWGEWSRCDPWWVRGVNFNVLDFLRGRAKYSTETLHDGIAVRIPMPEGWYHGTAKIERATWRYPRWFSRTRVSTWIDVPKGIPFAGKGENSWDCGDDGLFGCGVEGDSVERAITHFREQVERNRQRYGRPSDAAIVEALKA